MLTLRSCLLEANHYDKMRKLKALSLSNPFEHEARAAMQQYDKMVQKYGEPPPELPAELSMFMQGERVNSHDKLRKLHNHFKRVVMKGVDRYSSELEWDDRWSSLVDKIRKAYEEEVDKYGEGNTWYESQQPPIDSSGDALRSFDEAMAWYNEAYEDGVREIYRKSGRKL